MLKQDRTDWQFSFWSALTLEILAKAALSKISPVLLADGKNWDNTYYALVGHRPNTAKFKPRCLDISEVLKKIESIFPAFTKEMLDFTIIHMNRRNSELHTGDLPFDGLGTSQWLPKFYSCIEVLLSILEESLELLFGTDETITAKIQIKALKDKAAKEVNADINAHKRLWNNKDDNEKQKLQKQVEPIATRHNGHRVSCPSCDTTSLIQGSPCGAVKQELVENIVIEKQPHLPSLFECTACGLKISGYSKINACGLGDTYTKTSTYDASEYFGVDQDDEWYGYEEDNNEP